MPVITYRKALNDALAEELARDENVFIIGEEVAQYNGAYKVTEGLLARFGDKRVLDTPITEAAFVGLGVGASMLGLRPVIELMFWSFAFVAYDQIVNNAGCIRYMSGGLVNLPIVIRGPANGGTNVGATHSHTPENILANNPGIKVVCPATAYDAKGLMKTAIRDNDPVFVMENTLLYGETWEERILHHEDRVVVADRGFHQSFCVVSRGGANHLDAGIVDQDVLRCVRMRGANIGAAVGWPANDNGQIDQPARHVADAAGVIDDLVVSHKSKTPEHQFNHGAQSQHRGTHTQADECSFRNRRVQHPFIAKPRQ